MKRNRNLNLCDICIILYLHLDNIICTSIQIHFNKSKLIKYYTHILNDSVYVYVFVQAFLMVSGHKLMQSFNLLF